MMMLKVLGSSSLGNCYLIQNDDECLVIEAGISLKEVKKALNFNISKIVGCIVSHEHKDHAKYVKDFMNAGIKVYSTEVVRELTGCELLGAFHKLGNFKISVFDNHHDCECKGFYIEHIDMGKMVFATDTEYIDYYFDNINHLLVECNHSIDILGNAYMVSLKNRILKTHMELQTTLKFLKANNNPRLMNVLLIHLSDSASDEQLFIDEANKIVNCNVLAANRGLEMNLGLTPF